jgi:CheY-like chemotaxis protein
MPKILLVEDDNNLREIFEMRLKAEGYETVTAGNGEEALDVAMKQRPDLIIADVMMPKLSGFEMLESLRAVPEMANTKAVMMTALGQAEDRARGERLGVIKYLVKSQVTLEDFVRVVRDVLNPSDPAAEAAPSGVQTNSNPTNQESEAKMPEDTTTNPAAPAGDGSNPISGAPAEPSTQQTTAQEQSAVQDQINSFVSAPVDPGASDAMPSADVTAGPAAAPAMDAGAPAAMPAEPAAPAADGQADTSGTQPPASTEPAADPTQPPASTDAGAAPGNTL